MKYIKLLCTDILGMFIENFSQWGLSRRSLQSCSNGEVFLTKETKFNIVTDIP